MNKAKFVVEITVVDPDTKGDVQLSVYKHENGGMFAMDSSFLDQCTDEDSYPIIPDPFSANGKEQKGGTWLMLVEDNQISNFIGSVDLPQE
jgi:hypothetical protein